MANRVALLLRRMMTREPSHTTVTVTRVIGTHHDDVTGEEVPDTVIVTTEAPVVAKDPHQLAKTALIISTTALILAGTTLIWRILRDDWEHR